MSNQAQPSPEENEAQDAANQQAAPAAEQNIPTPESPEGKARAGRLYFALIIILFIFLGTIVGIYTLGDKVFVKIPTQITYFLSNEAPADEAAEESSSVVEESDASAAEEAPAEATEEAPAESPAEESEE